MCPKFWAGDIIVLYCTYTNSKQGHRSIDVLLKYLYVPMGVCTVYSAAVVVIEDQWIGSRHIPNLEGAQSRFECAEVGFQGGLEEAKTAGSRTHFEESDQNPRLWHCISDARLHCIPGKLEETHFWDFVLTRRIPRAAARGCRGGRSRWRWRRGRGGSPSRRRARWSLRPRTGRHQWRVQRSLLQFHFYHSAFIIYWPPSLRLFSCPFLRKSYSQAGYIHANLPPKKTKNSPMPKKSSIMANIDATLSGNSLQIRTKFWENKNYILRK